MRRDSRTELTAKENETLVKAIEKHWKFIDEQISKTMRGEKTTVKNIEK